MGFPSCKRLQKCKFEDVPTVGNDIGFLKTVSKQQVFLISELNSPETSINLIHQNVLLFFQIYTTVVRLCTLSLNFCRHVVAILSARDEEARFRMWVTLGVILIRSLVYTKHNPGRPLRSGSGLALK